MQHSSTLDLVVSLAGADTRAAAAEALAQRLGIETILLFARDPDLGALIPAPGLPQTLHGGRTWRAFLKRCATPGEYSGDVELPKGTTRHARAYAADGVAIVAVGGEPDASELPLLQRVLPLLASILSAEQAALVAKAEAAAAREAANRAHALATALETARADAAALNSELRSEHRRKDEFLAMLGHELRNPLAPLVTSLELLRRHKLDAATSKNVLDVMARQTSQLRRLVDDLLDVSRVSRGRIELKRERLTLSEVLADALAESQPIIDSQQHTVEIVEEDEPLVVSADRVRLTQIFSNLLNNAAKYTDHGGTLTVRTRCKRDSAIVQIGDTGIGIEADMLPRIFDLFTQGPVSLDRSKGGLGIGLTLVRTLVELHSGAVEADSAGPGKGSTFTVKLPLAKERARAGAQPERRRYPRPERSSHHAASRA
jgi:signal transduction histidine kinase